MQEWTRLRTPDVHMADEQVDGKWCAQGQCDELQSC